MTQPIPSHVTAYLHAYELSPDNYSFSVFCNDMSDCGYIPIARVEVPLPDIDLDNIKARHITLLRLERDQVYEKARKEAEALDERIARLEALTYTPQESAAEPAPFDDPHF